jgi:hypothetical protein
MQSRTLALVTILVGSQTSIGCITQGDREPSGRLELALTTGGVSIDTVAYQVLASDGATVLASGNVNVGDPNATASVFVSIPASAGDTARMTGTATDGRACSGVSSPFDVVAGQAVTVPIQIVCGGGVPPNPNGSTNISGTVVAGDNCPLITSWTASPSTATQFLGRIFLTATATDADVGELLRFDWQATAGTISASVSLGVSPIVTTATYTCGAAGPQTLTVTAVDYHVPTNCAVSQTIPVNCVVGPRCGDGVLDPGEECDPPNPGICSPDCFRLTPACGDGVIEAGEACDPPTPGLCSSACQVVPASCGDGVVEPGEDCDPPTLASCTGAVCCNEACRLQTFDQSPACQTCEQKAYATDPVSNGACLLAFMSGPDGFGCAGFSGQLQAECDALRACILSTQCAAGGDPTPCYCGTEDVASCISAPPPDAPCVAEYVAALAGGPPGSVASLFTNPTSPIGVANNIVACDVAAGCPCGQGPPPVCGNGIVERGEQCDPPNAQTGCGPTCIRTNTCGNGVVEPGEQCDPPTPGFCSATCQHIPPTPVCGNRLIEQGEQCDPPTPGFCSSTCQTLAPVCGDGILEAGEQCDPPVPGACSPTCQMVTISGQCGDGIVEAGEECDPPNLTTCTGSVCCNNGCLLQTFDQTPACEACERKTYPVNSPAQLSCDVNLYNNATGFACLGFTGQVRAECDALRTCILTTHCAGTEGYMMPDDPTPCYCGSLTPEDCLNASGSPTAACYAEYVAALAGGPPGTVASLFTDPTSPIGVADNLIFCDVDASCPCGQ